MYGGNKMTESKKIRFIIPLFLIFLMVFSACGNQNEEASSNSNRTDSNSVANNGSNTNDETNSEVEAQVITVAHQQPETHPVNISFTEKLEPMIEENSNGQLKVEIYGGAQLGGERDVMEQTQANQVQITHISPVLGSIYPPVNLTDLPYLFKDFDHVDSVLEGELGQQILEGMAEETGLRGMAFIDNGFRQITNNVREINSLSDLEGLKIRVPEAPISIENLSALGANMMSYIVHCNKELLMDKRMHIQQLLLVSFMKFKSMLRRQDICMDKTLYLLTTSGLQIYQRNFKKS